mmetsp:Transcript_12798/g.21650  ORF Transcript_12798/g.21650 Transcript_12798/m.21650 type:complete len:181 (+) Transcript_12798:2031-2573(+)
MMPVTDVFEAEVDILDLLDYKPIISKGYTCIMHIHTFNDEVIIKDITRSIEKNEKGEDIVKEKPQYAKSQTRILCRMTPKNPIALEKFDSINQMGRFTLRDEGKTICVGRVLRYKPYAKGAAGAAQMKRVKQAQAQQKMVTVDGTNSQKEMVYDMETGELKPKQNKDLTQIAEGNEEEDD